jgi:3-methyl-2-oxobutanoate hydroxymethyltransferase
MVMEMVPAPLADEITQHTRTLATIGIGASPNCHGQVLVLHDMLGITRGKLPRFVRNFMEGSGSVEDAVRRFVAAVKDGSFPAAEHGYQA